MSCSLFLDRAQAGWLLVSRLRDRCQPFTAATRPLVLAIPRGGVEVGAVRPRAPIAGRTVILTDDGLATGATMMAALRTVRAADPAGIIVALPVGSPDRLAAIEPLCDRLECLERPHDFLAVGQYYRSFEQVSDERVLVLLRDFGVATTPWPEVPVSVSA